MLSKCANPTCPTTFRYLRDGRLYVIAPRKPLPAQKPKCPSRDWRYAQSGACSFPRSQYQRPIGSQEHVGCSLSIAVKKVGRGAPEKGAWMRMDALRNILAGFQVVSSRLKLFNGQLKSEEMHLSTGQ
jgi:hypothetical protein